MCIDSVVSSTTADRHLVDQPLYRGVDSGDLIYLCDDGLVAFVASPAAVASAIAEEAQPGPHAFASATRVIDVDGLHARRLRDLSTVAGCPPVAIHEWMDWCDEVVAVAGLAHVWGDSNDAIIRLRRAALEVGAVDAETLTRARTALAREELLETVTTLAPTMDLHALLRTRVMLSMMARQARALAS